MPAPTALVQAGELGVTLEFILAARLKRLRGVHAYEATVAGSGSGTGKSQVTPGGQVGCGEGFEFYHEQETRRPCRVWSVEETLPDVRFKQTTPAPPGEWAGR